MLQPLSPSRSSQKNSKAQRRPLSRESSLKQVKLSDLFGSSSSSSSPVAPLTTSKAYNVHSERHRQYSPPPRMSQVETSTPCGPSSSSLAHRDMLLDIDSTDSEPESDSHSGAGSARKKARLELDVPFGFQTRPTSATHQARPYIRHVAGPKPKINHQSFYPGLNRPLNPLRWRAALETSLPLSSGLHSATCAFLPHLNCENFESDAQNGL